MIALVVVTDGRDEYLAAAVASVEATAAGPISERWLYDDTGDTAHTEKLTDRYPHFTVLAGGRRLGFGGAIAFTWAHLAEHSQAEWCLWWEDDFTAARPVDLNAMTAVLDAHPYLTQMALRRQPWSRPERTAGGVVEMHPEAYTDRCDELGRCWLEHRLFWTTNPSLYRLDLCRRGWLAGPQSEGRFALEVFTDQTARAGYWGARGDDPWVEHIGQERVGHGY